MVNKNLILLLITFSIFKISFAFDAHFGHPQLTEEIIKYYNHFAKRKITDEELEIIKLGSIKEDTSPRWVNHFYDPIHNQGLNFETYKGNKFLLKFFLASLPYRPLESPAWSQNEEAQIKYTNNKTYKYALREYFNNKEKAFLALGHLLHLLEDLGVPDHARGDSHAGIGSDKKSNYEDYAKKIIKNNRLNFVERLIQNNDGFNNFQDLNSIFHSLASFTANNWFSEDTIERDFPEPQIENLYSRKITFTINKNNNIFQEIAFIYSKDPDFKSILLVKIPEEGIKTTNDPQIHQAWFNTIVPQILKHGAALLNLYFSTIEEAERNEVLILNYQFEGRKIALLKFFGELSLSNLFSYIKTFTWQGGEKIIVSISKVVNNILPKTTQEPLPILQTISYQPEEKQTSILTEKEEKTEYKEEKIEFPKTTYKEERKEIVIKKIEKPLLTNKQPTTSAFIQEKITMISFEKEDLPKTTTSIEKQIDKQQQKEEQKQQEKQVVYTQGGFYSPPRNPCEDYKNKNYPNIIINEIQFETKENTKDEFIELYNPNNQEIDLTCWRLEKYASKQTATLTPTLIELIPESKFKDIKIKPFSFLLITHPSSSVINISDLTYASSYSISKNNTLILRKPNGEVSDLLGYGDDEEKIYQFEGSPFLKENFENKSIQRKNFQDTNNNQEDFWLHSPTPKNTQFTEKPREDFLDLTKLEIKDFQVFLTSTEESYFLNLSFQEPTLSVTSTNYSYHLLISTSTEFNTNTFNLEDLGTTSGLSLPQFSGTTTNFSLEITQCPSTSTLYYFAFYLQDNLDKENRSKTSIASTTLPENLCQPSSEETPLEEPTSTSATSTGPILFSEIYIKSGTSTGEFIELYNPNDYDIDLTGWRIERIKSTGKNEVIVPSSKFRGIIPAFSYFLLMNNSLFYTTSSDITDKIEIISPTENNRAFNVQKLSLIIKPKENVILGGLRIVHLLKYNVDFDNFNLYDENRNFLTNVNIKKAEFKGKVLGQTRCGSGLSETNCSIPVFDYFFEKGLILEKDKTYILESDLITILEIYITKIYQYTPDLLYGKSYNLASNNSLILYNKDNQIVDQFSWNEIDNHKSFQRKKTANSTENSLLNEEKDRGNAYDSNNNSDFILAPINPENSLIKKETIKEIKDFKLEKINKKYKFSWFSPAFYDQNIVYELRYSTSATSSFENSSPLNEINSTTLPTFQNLFLQEAELQACPSNIEISSDENIYFHLALLKDGEILKTISTSTKAIECNDISENFSLQSYRNYAMKNNYIEFKVLEDVFLEELQILNFNQCPTACRHDSRFSSLEIKINKLITTTTEIEIPTTTYITVIIPIVTTTEDGSTTTIETTTTIPTTTIMTTTTVTTTETTIFSTSTFEEMLEGCFRIQIGMDNGCDGPEFNIIDGFYFLYKVPINLSFNKEDILRIYANYQETMFFDDGWWVHKFKGK